MTRLDHADEPVAEARDRGAKKVRLTSNAVRTDAHRFYERLGFVRSHFGIADDRLVVCGISFGYEDAAHPANSFRTRRAPLSEAVTWLDQ